MPTLTTVSCWTITASEDIACVTHAAVGDYWAPRVWSGHGLAIAGTDLAGFEKVLGEVMKLPVYWQARARCGDCGAGDAAIWSEPRCDPDDDFVYLSGPCRAGEPTAGYRPVSAFTLDLVNLRGLRIRIAAYRARGTRGLRAPRPRIT
ncbi:hypothetical protein ACFQ05_22100 [Amycolatopsis umgeniensis]|uniref:Uncharacterized protein n=1 Tax=Amycolatopsis umgeniensis TaxID=336628 RepID=A0A841BE80_9PSEU|nr:hypothetical protein [Amycolatopsis umgeniensis]MBB5858316.1 hypothetical protein [Amycolatopsis umgeniensis]